MSVKVTKTTKPTGATKDAEAKAGPRLRRETVVDAALALLDEVGLDGLTMRRLAEALGVQNPALYWHFKNKQELLDRMAAAMLQGAFGTLEQPPADASWTDWMAGIAQGYRRAMLSRRDGARVIASANLLQSELLLGLDRALAVLARAGFSHRDAFVGVLALFDYTLGATFEQQSDPLREPTPSELRAGAEHPVRKAIDPKTMPTLAANFDAIVRDIGEASPGASFSFDGGVRLLIDGLRARLAAARSAPPGPHEPAPAAQPTRPRAPRAKR